MVARACRRSRAARRRVLLTRCGACRQEVVTTAAARSRNGFARSPRTPVSMYLCGTSKKPKQSLAARFGGFRRHFRPALRVRHSFFAELHQHFAFGQVLALHNGRRRHELIPVLQHVGRSAAPDGDIIELTAERVARAAAVAGANRQVVGVSDRSQRRRPGFVPGASSG